MVCARGLCCVSGSPSFDENNSLHVVAMAPTAVSLLEQRALATICFMFFLLQ